MYYTEREVKELLEQAFAEGYDNGIDDTLDYIDENYEIDGDFDLEDEYEYYTESNAETKARNRETGKRAFQKRLEEERKTGTGFASFYYNKGGSGNIQHPKTDRYYHGGERGRLHNEIKLNHAMLKNGEISPKDVNAWYKDNRYNRKRDKDKLPG